MSAKLRGVTTGERLVTRDQLGRALRLIEAKTEKRLAESEGKARERYAQIERAHRAHELEMHATWRVRLQRWWRRRGER